MGISSAFKSFFGRGGNKILESAGAASSTKANLAKPFQSFVGKLDTGRIMSSVDNVGFMGAPTRGSMFKSDLMGQTMADSIFDTGWKSAKMAMWGAAAGGTFGALGSAVAPESVQTQSPFKSAFLGAAGGFGLGAARGLTKIANPYVSSTMGRSALKFTNDVASSKVTRGALYAATAFGSFETSFTKPMNRVN